MMGQSKLALKLVFRVALKYAHPIFKLVTADFLGPHDLC